MTENLKRKTQYKLFEKKLFIYRGAVSWNSLPSEIVYVHDQLSLPSFITLINHYDKDLEKNSSPI